MGCRALNDDEYLFLYTTTIVLQSVRDKLSRLPTVYLLPIIIHSTLSLTLENRYPLGLDRRPYHLACNMELYWTAGIDVVHAYPPVRGI